MSKKLPTIDNERKGLRVKPLELLDPVDDYNMFRNKESYKKAIETAKKMIGKNRCD